MKKISIKAVVIGGITDIVGTNIWGIILGVYLVTSGLLLADNSMAEQLKAIININLHPTIFIINLAMGGFFSIVGGYVSALIVKHDELINGTLSSFLCVGLGIYGIASGQGSHSLILQSLGLLISPFLGFLGGYIRKRMMVVNVI